MSKIHDQLNIKLPIWSAGMGLGIAGAALSCAVSEARGLGVLGLGGMDPASMGKLIADMRAHVPCVWRQHYYADDAGRSDRNML